jgi:hypothetical protein
VLLLAGNVPWLVHALTWSVLIDPSILVCMCWLISVVVAWYTDTCQLVSGIMLPFLLPLSILCYWILAVELWINGLGNLGPI